MLYTLTPKAKTIPCNYSVKPIDYSCNTEVGSTVTDWHWHKAQQYEQEVERATGMKYADVAQTIMMMDRDDLEAEELKNLIFGPMYQEACDTALATVYGLELDPELENDQELEAASIDDVSEDIMLDFDD